MTKSICSSKAIVLDSDVIIHFVNGALFGTLAKMYSGRLIILDKVKEEVTVRKGFYQKVKPFIDRGMIQEISFPIDITYLKEYAFLISETGRAFGKGESACMVYCRYNSNVLASSNLRDIRQYCDYHGIEYVTSADILFDAFSQGIIDKARCEKFINKIIAKGSRFPFSAVDDFLAFYMKNHS